MRKVRYLIDEAKANTNTIDAEAITDALCSKLLTRAQSFIQAYIFNQNVNSKILRGETEFTTTTGQDTYDLPFDIYAVNSVIAVQQKITSGI